MLGSFFAFSNATSTTGPIICEILPVKGSDIINEVKTMWANLTNNPFI
jgi:hypothetical protein